MATYYREILRLAKLGYSQWGIAPQHGLHLKHHLTGSETS